MRRDIREAGGLGMTAPKNPRDRGTYQDIQSALSCITAEEISARIRSFRRSNTRNLSDEDLVQQILDLLTTRRDQNGQTALLRTYGRRIIAGTHFFRARKTSGVWPLNVGALAADALPPPPEITRAGRVNKAGEPILYTVVGNAPVTLEECRATTGEKWVIFVYEGLRELKCPLIGGVDQDENLTPEELFKLNLFNDFLHDEFSREVECGLEHIYRTSNYIAKWYFDLPSDYQDCWLYSSTKRRDAYVAAFKPQKAAECLQLVGTILVEPVEDERQLLVWAVGQPRGDEIVYFVSGSPEHEALFRRIGLV